MQLQEELREYKSLLVSANGRLPTFHCHDFLVCLSPVHKRTDNDQERDPYVLVLIDGDGMIFEDILLSHGEAGGKEAAARLWSALHQKVKLLELPSDVKIVTRIYANLKGLAETCVKAGITTRADTMEDFARAFTGSKQLFDFVDVGMGKDRADDKVSGN